MLSTCESSVILIIPSLCENLMVLEIMLSPHAKIIWESNNSRCEQSASLSKAFDFSRSFSSSSGIISPVSLSIFVSGRKRTESDFSATARVKPFSSNFGKIDFRGMVGEPDHGNAFGKSAVPTRQGQIQSFGDLNGVFVQNFIKIPEPPSYDGIGVFVLQGHIPLIQRRGL